MVAHHGGWTPVHVTVDRVELDEGVYAGVAAFRLPTPEELTVAGLDGPDEPTSSKRKARVRKTKDAEENPATENSGTD